MFIDPSNYTEIEKLNQEESEGAYTFRPEWYDQMPHPYSRLDEDITYQQGSLVEQWTILYYNRTSKERAIVNVRYMPLFSEFIEFEVLLTPIPVEDGQGKDVTVNWSFYDGFDPQGVFYTDSNGLEMEERRIKIVGGDKEYINNELGYNYQTIGANYYPVDSAIAMRDTAGGTNLQVTIMPDRAMGGSADLTARANIELMHNRRLLRDDNLGVIEALNETESDG
jgi:hypothetical protein